MLCADSSLSAAEPEPPRQLASRHNTRSANADPDSDADNANKEDDEDDISMMSMTDDEEEKEKSPSRCENNALMSVLLTMHVAQAAYASKIV